MPDDQVIYLDSAIDVIGTHSDYLRVVTPTGGFTIKDSNAVVRKVMEALQSGSSLEELLNAFSNDAEKLSARSAVELLERRRLLSVHEPSEFKDRLMSWIRHGAGAAHKTLPQIEMMGDGALADSAKRRLLELGFSLTSEKTLGERVIVAAADFSDMDALRFANARAIQSGYPFLPVWLARSTIFVGPFVEPSACGCLECLYHRERAALRMSDKTLDLQIEGVGQGASSIAINIAVELAVVELLRWVFGAHIDTEFGIGWRFDLMNFSLSGQSVLRLPRCPVCGGNHVANRHA